ncbi:MAG TPA: SelB C-terminal domain-containing protein [Streptosporangiaceae bacterium]
MTTQVVATAGHVDHGKSTLVRALTGRETDRWAEERRRGLTIDLGFAWMALPGNLRVAFVDVPGHERFVPNMLSGMGPVPAVLFVVAADEGWMPQSAEHLAAVDALGVTHGLLAVTRSDLADPEPARRDALARIAETSLGVVPYAEVSGVTGAGLAELRAALATLVAGMPVPDPESDVRLWLDRSFTIGGAGLVVTGTLPAGRIRTGDRLTLASTGREVRVRGLQTLEEAADEVTGVARVAVNLRGADRPRRGDALLARDVWRTTDQVDCVLPGPGRLGAGVPGAGPPDAAGSGAAGSGVAGSGVAGDDVVDLAEELTVHVGAAAVAARVRPLGGRVVRLRLARALPLRYGDRLLLRDPGRHLIAAAAIVVDPAPPELRRRGAGRERAAELGLVARPEDAAVVKLRRMGFVRTGDLRALGLPAPGKPVAGDWHADPELWAALPARLREATRDWAREHKLEPGLPADVALRALGLSDRALLAAVIRRAGLSAADGRIVSPGTDNQLPPQVTRAVEAILTDLRAKPFAAPDANALAHLGLGPRELAAAVRAGRLLKIADGIVLAPDAVDRARPVLAALPQPFTLSDARKALGTTRRVAVPLLEHLDAAGVTARLPDDTRRVI